jgi:NAD(P)-dependent dehydrogenase (short-subunit alcohol dehydrogenase family)
MTPTYDFNGQVALVTGASSGVGLASAQAFAEAGTAVALADINADALQGATDELGPQGASPGAARGRGRGWRTVSRSASVTVISRRNADEQE